MLTDWGIDTLNMTRGLKQEYFLFTDPLSIIAAALLIAKGFRILARRFKSPVGEIDIVARRRQLLVFVEVKARNDLDEAAWLVTPRQQQRIAAAAEAWLAGNPDESIRDIRFDAILVAPGKLPRHIQGAFETS